MRDLPHSEQFPSYLIDDMHKAFDAVCVKLRLSPRADKATEIVATKIVELARAGQRGDDLTAKTLQFFEGQQPERRTDDRPRRPEH
jgi:hypothetical protein